MNKGEAITRAKSRPFKLALRLIRMHEGVLALAHIVISFGQNSRSQETPEITKLSTSGKHVKYEGNQYVNSLYPVKRQTTAVKLSSGSVESYTKLQPVKQEGNKLTYGPYENTEASKI
uniref:Dolichyl-diphosphooligosaccharide--protein glycosyltransferase subunit 1 n=1 Tax=Romanomermis culicivorax TaxID=13658 RepID=A0A915L570_ROMCU